MNLNEINSLLDRYLSGNCSSEEKELIETWFEKSGRHEDEWSEMDETKREEWISNLFEDIQTTISSGNEPVIIVKRPFFRMWPAAAAAIALIVLCCFLYNVYLQKPDYTEIKVAVAHRTNFVLSDGTVVWLNAGSSLKYPKRFQGKSREVFLNGEGFFEVSHNPDNPFIVHTGDVQTKVLGTVFNIKAYKEDNEVQVALLSGKVEMNGAKGANSKPKKLVIDPNQLGTYNKEHHILGKTVKNDLEAYSAWRNGRLIFDETPLSEVLKTLSRSYEISFNTDGGELSQCKITGTFNTKESIEQIIKSICVSIDAAFYRNSKSITIRGKGC